MGDVAQLGEHLLCKQGVVGSIPIVSTIVVDKADCRLRLAVRLMIRVCVSQRSKRFGAGCGVVSRSSCRDGPGCAVAAPLVLPPDVFREAAIVLCQGESGSGASLDARDGKVRKGWCCPVAHP